LFDDLPTPGPVLTCMHGSDFFGPTPCCEAEADRLCAAHTAQPPRKVPHAQLPKA
jgi:hypothetical protein